MIVLLNVAWMCATPCGTMRFSRFFLNSFLRFDVFAGCLSGAALLSAVLLPSQYPRFNLDDSCDYVSADRYLRAAIFFFAATAPLRGPLRVRALVCVRWPRTGRLRRWRKPR